MSIVNDFKAIADRCRELSGEKPTQAAPVADFLKIPVPIRKKVVSCSRCFDLGWEQSRAKFIECRSCGNPKALPPPSQPVF